MVKELTGINVFRIDNPRECSIIERLNRFVVCDVKEGGEGILLFIAALPHVKVFKPNKAADAKLYEDLTVAHASGGADIRAIGLYFNPKDACVYLFNHDLEIKLS